MLLMLMVVAVGAAMMLYMALRVPAFTSELRAYFGQTELVVDAEDSRRAHLALLMYLYAAPLGLGIFVHLLHHVINWFSRISSPAKESPEFEMGTGSLQDGNV